MKNIHSLDAKIDVFLNTKPEAAGVAEVPAQELIFLHLQPTLKKLHCFFAPNRHIACNLLITPNAKGPNSVPCCSHQNIK